jgi:AraC-like DNA-binding protein
MPNARRDHAALALQLLELECAQGEMRDGWVHRKCIPFAIVVQPLSGWYEISGPDHAIEVASGEVAVIASELPVRFIHHAAAGRSLMSARWMHVQACLHEHLDPFALIATPHRIHGANARSIGRLLASALKATGADEASGLMRVGLAYQAIAIALTDAPAHAQAPRLRAGSGRLGALTAWLRAHLDQPLDVPTIARHLELSPSRLHAICQQHLGMPPMSYLKDLRLSAAARELLTTTDPVMVISERTGFANAFHFSREFSRRYRMSPRQYRDDQRLSMEP